MYKQRTERVALADSDTTAYRYCLDALIATIGDMRSRAFEFDRRGLSGAMLHQQVRDVQDAEERAAELAHRLFEKFIEVVPERPKFGRRIARWEVLREMQEHREHADAKEWIELYHEYDTGNAYVLLAYDSVPKRFHAVSVVQAIYQPIERYVRPLRRTGVRIERVV